MHRFLYHLPLLDKISLKENNPQFHQIMRVFRAKKGDRVAFFIPGGEDTVYEIIQITKKEILFLRREEIVNLKKKYTHKITLFQAYPNKITTGEIIVQKCTELGIDEIVFFPSDHSQIQIIPVIKQSRISIIAQEALEQSGGNTPISLIYDVRGVEKLFTEYSHLEHIVGYPGGIGKPNLSNNSSLGLWIGPEGGWSPQEEDFFLKNKSILWSFSDTILRLETASIVGSGILAYLLSDIV